MSRNTRLKKAGVALGALAMVASGVAGTVSPASAGFAGLNGKIACTSNRTGNFEIFTFESTGTEVNPTNLTNDPSFDSRPRWRSDGRKIVFESNRSGAGTDLYTADADGTNVARLTFTGDASNGSWHPDGSQILYQRNIPGLSFEIYKVNLDGTGVTPLASSPVEDSLGFWNHEGTVIAFNSRRLEGQAVGPDIYTMDSFGNNLVNITNFPNVEDAWPNWSPDGSQIAFHSRRLDSVGEEIYRMDADGSNVVQLTNNVGNFDIFPFWSPDGTRVGFNTQRAGVANFGEVFHMSATAGDGSGLSRITSNDAIDMRCDWQPLCTHYATAGVVLTGTPGNDVICGSEGDDRIDGLGGDDIIYGFGGNDQIVGGDGADRIFGGLGNDSIVGGAGADFLSGGPGNDRFSADSTDRIDPGSGTNQCAIAGADPVCPARLS